MRLTREELIERASPLVELLKEKGRPYLSVIITKDEIKVMETVASLPIRMTKREATGQEDNFPRNLVDE